MFSWVYLHTVYHVYKNKQYKLNVYFLIIQSVMEQLNHFQRVEGRFINASMHEHKDAMMRSEHFSDAMQRHWCEYSSLFC